MVWERELAIGNGFRPEAVRAIRVGKQPLTMIYLREPHRSWDQVSFG
jgi:hypothetical protein